MAGDGPVALKLARNLRAEKRKLVLFSPKVVLVSSDDETLTRAAGQAHRVPRRPVRPESRCAPRA